MHIFVTKRSRPMLALALAVAASLIPICQTASADPDDPSQGESMNATVRGSNQALLGRAVSRTQSNQSKSQSHSSDSASKSTGSGSTTTKSNGSSNSTGATQATQTSSGTAGDGGATGSADDSSDYGTWIHPDIQELAKYAGTWGDYSVVGIPRTTPQPEEPKPQQQPAAQPARPEPPKLTRQQRAEIAWTEVRAQMNLTAPAAGVAPDHSVNHLYSETTGRPLDSAVGYPLWFWAVGGDQQAKSVTKKAAGMKVSFSMRPAGLTVNPGDGSTFQCASMGTPWTPAVRPGTPSPTCGYVYSKTGTYTVTMTTRWAVHYEISDGQGAALIGDQVFSGTSSRILRIGELQVVVTHG